MAYILIVMAGLILACQYVLESTRATVKSVFVLCFLVHSSEAGICAITAASLFQPLSCCENDQERDIGYVQQRKLLRISVFYP